MIRRLEDGGGEIAFAVSLRAWETLFTHGVLEEARKPNLTWRLPP